MDNSQEKKRFFASADHSLDINKASPKQLAPKVNPTKTELEKYSSLKGILGSNSKPVPLQHPISPHTHKEEGLMVPPVCPIHSESSDSGRNVDYEANLNQDDLKKPASSIVKLETLAGIPSPTIDQADFSHKTMANHSTEAKTDSKPRENSMIREKSPPPVPKLDLSAIIENRNRKNKPLGEKQ